MDERKECRQDAEKRVLKRTQTGSGVPLGRTGFARWLVWIATWDESSKQNGEKGQGGNDLQ